jgi:NADH-quinone oxidoreductase subunit C/D
MPQQPDIISEIRDRFPETAFSEQSTQDNVATIWVSKDDAKRVMTYLKNEADQPFKMLYDLTAIDERSRRETPADKPASDFTAVYHLLSMDRNSDVRIKVPLTGEYPTIPSITDLWPSANWYEREAWDMFGINFDGHPLMRRILTPNYWEGHPLRKEYAARATEGPGYTQTDESCAEEESYLKFKPEEWGDSPTDEDGEFMYLNLGPHHPGMHGLLRFVLKMRSQEIVDEFIDIGYHHRGAEKMAERQTFHTYIPYTDRVDYQAGVQNNMPYVMAVEKLAGIEIPQRAEYIRVMMCELYRIINHLVFLGTFGADIGAFSPVFFTFNDRERAFDITEAICGGRMHPAWFRIGGVADDLPEGWKGLIDDFLNYLPARLAEYETVLNKTAIFKARTKGIGVYTTDMAIEWGVTGPNLRSTGSDWDLRKKRPYSVYDQFDFEVPTMTEGDCFARAVIRIEEIRQSMRIMKQAAENMPGGDYKSDSPFAMPPRKERSLKDIETLINHFLSVSWGKPMPVGESMVSTEAPKGNYGYYIHSDGNPWAYRCRIRASSFPHMQSVPLISLGTTVSDLVTILGSIDYVLADVDR